MAINSNQPPLVSVILPCQNEELSIGKCITEIKDVFEKNNIFGEIIVSDSSQDKSPEIAREMGVILAKHDKDGYGQAYLEGFKVASGRYLFLADTDGTYSFSEIPKFLSFLNSDYDLVIGNRLAGKIYPGAMPYTHRYFGTPLLSVIFSLFFKNKIGDINCGMRAISRQALDSLDLKSTGMEFASEMMVKAVKKDLKIKETPIDYFSRIGESKLRTIPDGWRHLKFMFGEVIR